MAGREDYEERKQRKIEKYQELAEKAKGQSDAHYEQYRRMADIIPLGQPILVDHYSANRTRNGYKRMNTQFEKSMEKIEKAKYYEQKVNVLEKNKAISSDDPKAIEKLESKLQELEEYKKRVKAREHAPYELSNLNQEMRRIRQRIKELKELEELEFEEIIFDGGKVIHNKEINRIQFIFDDKPDEKIREILKHYGFKWARTEGAWQRLFNKNGIYTTRYILDKMEDLK